MKIIKILDDTVVTNWGTAVFRAVKKVKRKHCNWCWLRETNCEGVPCGYGAHPQIKYGQVGVFTIQEMPVV